MYSVFKALKKDYDIAFLDKIGNSMNKKKDGIYTGIRKTNDGIAIEISESNSWNEQCNEIILFIKLFRKQLRQLKNKKYNIFIDMAVEHDEIYKQGWGLFLHYDINFLKFLCKNNIEYEISIYR